MKQNKKDSTHDMHPDQCSDCSEAAIVRSGDRQTLLDLMIAVLLVSLAGNTVAFTAWILTQLK